jgi:hypothetical protein
MPDWIYLDHPMTWVMDSNKFNNLTVFINYFYLIYDRITYLQYWAFKKDIYLGSW